MTNKILFFDCETTGLNPTKNDIIQISGIIEIDNKEADRFNIKMQPFNWDNIEQEALNVHGISIEKLKEFQKPDIAYREIVTLFDKHIDKYDKDDKFIVCGYNVRFDIDFLKEFFHKNGNEYLFSYFGQVKDPMQVINYLRTIGKIDVINSKLTSVCEYFNIDIGQAHDAMADIVATKLVAEKLDDLLK